MSDSSFIELMPRRSMSAIVTVVADMGLLCRVSLFSDAVISTRSMLWWSESAGCCAASVVLAKSDTMTNNLFTGAKLYLFVQPINPYLWGDLRPLGLLGWYDR